MAASTASCHALLLLARDGHAVFEHCRCGGDSECERLHWEARARIGHEFSGVIEQQPVDGAAHSAVSRSAEEDLVEIVRENGTANAAIGTPTHHDKGVIEPNFEGRGRVRYNKPIVIEYLSINAPTLGLRRDDARRLIAERAQGALEKVGLGFNRRA